jgi:photosystem II stability/assembly factor-like uncharacterized protein
MIAHNTSVSRVLILLVVLASMCEMASAQATVDGWELVDSVLIDDEFGRSSALLSEIECPDDQRCFVAGSHGNVLTFLRATSDRGRTWQTSWSDSTIVRGEGDIRFARQVRGLAADRLGFVLAALDSGVVLRSTDFGQTWIEVRLPRRASVRDVVIIGSTEAMVLQDTMVWYSNDRGATWANIDFLHPLHSLGYRAGILAARSQNHWLIGLGRRAGVVYATTANAGATWSNVGPLDGRTVSRIVLGASGLGWSVGGDTLNRHEVVARTSDSGASWQIVLDTVPLGRWAHGLLAIAVWRDRLVLVAGSDGAVWRSSDRGTTWTAISDGIATDDPGENITDIALLDSVSYAAVSTSGAVRFYRSSLNPVAVVADAGPISTGPTISSDGEVIFVNVPSSIVPSVDIFDAIGRRVQIAPDFRLEGGGRLTISMREFRPGTYVVRVAGPFGVRCGVVAIRPH